MEESSRMVKGKGDKKPVSAMTGRDKIAGFQARKKKITGRHGPQSCNRRQGGIKIPLEGGNKPGGRKGRKILRKGIQGAPVLVKKRLGTEGYRKQFIETAHKRLLPYCG